MALTRGRTTNSAVVALDDRLMDMAALVCNADRSPRTGVMGGANASIVTTTANTGPMTVNVAAAEFACSKSTADGVTHPTNDGTASVTISAAPGSNSRITVVWVKQNDNTTGDANSTPVFGTTDGTAAASPTKPAIPTGALELATLRVYSGTTASNGGSNVLTNTYQMTAARGGVVPFRTLTELNLWTNPTTGQLATVLADTSGSSLYKWNGSAWAITSPYLGDVSVTSGAQSGITAETALTSASVAVTVPRAGRVKITVNVATNSTSVDDLVVIRLKDGATILNDYTARANSSHVTSGTTQTHNFTIRTTLTAGAHTIALFALRALGSGAIATSPGASVPTQILVESID